MYIYTYNSICIFFISNINPDSPHWLVRWCVFHWYVCGGELVWCVVSTSFLFVFSACLLNPLYYWLLYIHSFTLTRHIYRGIYIYIYTFSSNIQNPRLLSYLFACLLHHIWLVNVAINWQSSRESLHSVRLWAGQHVYVCVVVIRAGGGTKWQ